MGKVSLCWDVDPFSKCPLSEVQVIILLSLLHGSLALATLHMENYLVGCCLHQSHHCGSHGDWSNCFLYTATRLTLLLGYSCATPTWQLH